MSNKCHLVITGPSSTCGLPRPKNWTRSIASADCRSCLRQALKVLHDARREVIARMDKLGMFPATPAGRAFASREQETSDATDIRTDGSGDD